MQQGRVNNVYYTSCALGCLHCLIELSNKSDRTLLFCWPQNSANQKSPQMVKNNFGELHSLTSRAMRSDWCAFSVQFFFVTDDSTSKSNPDQHVTKLRIVQWNFLSRWRGSVDKRSSFIIKIRWIIFIYIMRIMWSWWPMGFIFNGKQYFARVTNLKITCFHPPIRYIRFL